MGLEPLFSWFPELLAWIVSWLPHGARLPIHEGGVKISGKNVIELDRHKYWSWYVWCPRFSEIYTCNVKRQVIELREQLLTTSDGKRVRVGGTIVYYVINVVTWIVENEEADKGVKVESSRVLRDWVKDHEFADIQKFKPKNRSADDLTRLAQSEFGSDFGIRITRLSLASFAETESRDLYHSGISSPPIAESE